MNATAVTDTTDWLLAQPIQTAPGETVDFSGTRLSVVFRPIRGGEVIAEASTDDGSLAFVGGATPYFRIDLPVARRTLPIGRSTMVRGDIERQPDPLDATKREWLGRIDLVVGPGSGSPAIALAAQAPVLGPAQPYDGRIVTAPMPIGPQGPSGAPTYQAVTDLAGLLAIDLREGAYAKAALSEPAALALVGWPTDFEMGRLTVELDIAAGATLTGYPAGTIWSNGVAPLLSVGPAKDLLMFTSIDGGQTVFGHVIGQNYRS